MAERLNAAVLKTVLGNTNGGSNPSLSATYITLSSNGRTSGFGPLNGSSNLSGVTKEFFDIKKERRKIMEQILAFGLGIMLVITIVLIYVVLKSGKQVSKCVEQLRDVERTFDNVWREINDKETDLHRNIDEVNRKIDSRVDKLYDTMQRELEETNRKVEFLRKSTGKDYF